MPKVMKMLPVVWTAVAAQTRLRAGGRALEPVEAYGGGAAAVAKCMKAAQSQGDAFCKDWQANGCDNFRELWAPMWAARNNQTANATAAIDQAVCSFVQTWNGLGDVDVAACVALMGAQQRAEKCASSGGSALQCVTAIADALEKPAKDFCTEWNKLKCAQSGDILDVVFTGWGTDPDASQQQARCKKFINAYGDAPGAEKVCQKLIGNGASLVKSQHYLMDKPLNEILTNCLPVKVHFQKLNICVAILAGSGTRKERCAYWNDRHCNAHQHQIFSTITNVSRGKTTTNMETNCLNLLGKDDDPRLQSKKEFLCSSFVRRLSEGECPAP